MPICKHLVLLLLLAGSVSAGALTAGVARVEITPPVGYVLSGYGANTIVTRVEVGAGARMVDRGLIHIYRMLGKLKDKPEQL